MTIYIARIENANGKQIGQAFGETKSEATKNARALDLPHTRRVKTRKTEMRVSMSGVVDWLNTYMSSNT